MFDAETCARIVKHTNILIGYIMSCSFDYIPPFSMQNPPSSMPNREKNSANTSTDDSSQDVPIYTIENAVSSPSIPYDDGRHPTNTSNNNSEEKSENANNKKQTKSQSDDTRKRLKSKKRTKSQSDDTRKRLKSKTVNKGDKAEVRIKKILKSETEKESSPLLCSLFDLGPMDTVRFPPQSMQKASNTEKADCFIEVERDQTNTLYKISIKFQGSNDCSIVNQDHRAKSAYLPAGRNGEEGLLFHCLGGLDTLISRLNYERAIGERQQDIDFTDIDFTAVERKAMEDVLVHHSFFGAGTGTFQFGVQANSILIVRNVNDLNSWVLTHCPTLEDKKKYIQSKWDQYIFAIRRKGKQEEKSYDNSQELLDCVLPWFVPRFVNRVEKKGYNYEGAGREYVAKPHHDAKCTLNVRMKKK